MSTLSGIYDSNAIQPIAKIRENLSIWTVSQWSHYRIENIEPLPRSSPMVVEMIVASGAAFLLPYGTINQMVVAILQPRENEFIHIRWQPLDDVEGILWEQAGKGRFVTRSVHARVTLETIATDPFLSTTTFWILGRDRNMNLEVRNMQPITINQARFVFFGFRYMLNKHEGMTAKDIEAGRISSTYVPAEGF
jgi:hypothetical protein